MNKKRLILPIVAILLFVAVTFYVICPPINLHSTTFWFWIFWIAIVSFVAFSVAAPKGEVDFVPTRGRRGVEQVDVVVELFRDKKKNVHSKILKVIAWIIAGMVVLFLLGQFFSGRLINAKAYSQILKVEEGQIEDIPSVDETDAIALMDTNSARSLGDRKIGTLSHVVSQYELIGYDYTQINWKNRPVKVAPLSYGGFFKWINNRGSGVPGYVAVDPVSMEADYMELDSGMHLVPSAYFGEDLNRYLRFRYPTVIYEEPHFEVDEEGNPWYVAPIVHYSIFLFGGERISGVLTANPVTGETYRYALAEVPDWVDLAIPGDLICRQYNDYAQLQRGYLNSIFGQVGCREVTRASITDDSDNFDADYGYIAKDNDIYIYTGITSVNGDASNIGFIMANERTGKTIFIDAPGANEFSATNAAEGEVQEKGYMASFPSLITIDEVPTYIMVLRDKSNLVKMYACVNVEQYNMVVNATKQKDCIDKYRALLRGDISQEEANDENTVVDDTVNLDEFEKTRVTIKKLETIDRGGDTYLYLVDEQNRIFHAKYADVIGMLLVSEGDTIEIYIKDDQFYYKP